MYDLTAAVKQAYRCKIRKGRKKCGLRYEKGKVRFYRTMALKKIGETGNNNSEPNLKLIVMIIIVCIVVKSVVE